MNTFTCISFFVTLGFLAIPAHSSAADRLHLNVFVADTNSFSVTSTLIEGEGEAILVDVQFHMSEAAKLADRIAASGKRLKAIIISHPDDDHYLCMALFRQRFPATPMYMSEAALKEFQRTSARYLKMTKSYAPAETPDSLPIPEALPTTHFLVDGEHVEVITDLQGDTWKPSNSYLWIPSLRAVVAGDLVFNGVHPWLANSNRKSRRAWIASLDQLAALHPRIVIAGHKRDGDTPDGPEAIAATEEYIKAFDELVDVAAGSDDLVARMKLEFPGLTLPAILARSAKIAIPD